MLLFGSAVKVIPFDCRIGRGFQFHRPDEDYSEAKTITFGNLNFGFDKYQITKEMEPALEQALAPALLEYRVAPEDPPGVRVHAGGWELEWTLDSYLANLQERVVRLLEEEAGHASPP